MTDFDAITARMHRRVFNRTAVPAVVLLPGAPEVIETRGVYNRSSAVAGEFGQVVDRRRSVQVLKQDVEAMPRGTTVTFEGKRPLTVDQHAADDGYVLEAWVQ